MKSLRREVYVVLHNIRSVHNVGSIFRTADCLGVSDIVLVGSTPTPLDRFGRLRKDFAKVALGADKALRWRYFKTIIQALRFLDSQGAFVVAVEQSPAAVDYRKVKPRYPLAFVFGNEVEGIPEAVLQKCDIIAEIPMRGRMVRQAHHPRHPSAGKESLNVSVAAGVALARVLSCQTGSSKK